MNKESLLSQIQIVEDNMRRLRTLCETELMHGDVPLYCIIKARIQLENLERELRQSNETEIVDEIMDQHKKYYPKKKDINF